MNIYEYFNSKLGTPPSDESLKELPVDSVCGAECKSAIDAGAALIQHLRSAFGRGDERSEDRAHDIFYTVDSIVECYWRG
jgi:hypothetical protein